MPFLSRKIYFPSTEKNLSQEQCSSNHDAFCSPLYNNDRQLTAHAAALLVKKTPLLSNENKTQTSVSPTDISEVYLPHFKLPSTGPIFDDLFRIKYHKIKRKPLQSKLLLPTQKRNDWCPIFVRGYFGNISHLNSASVACVSL